MSVMAMFRQLTKVPPAQPRYLRQRWLGIASRQCSLPWPASLTPGLCCN